MAITTKEYSITQATPAGILNAMETAFADLGWHDAETLGYILTFTNTAGSAIQAEANKRYLVNPSASTGSGTLAVFDVLRTGLGGISAVTLVNGGSGYGILGYTGVSSSGTTVTVSSTTGINVGMVVTKIAGTGTLQTNTVVVSITNATQLVISEAPSVALSAAVVQFVDTVTIGASDIGGAVYTTTATGTSGQTTITVASNVNVLPGQRVTGTGIGPLAVVSSIAGNVITLSKNNIGTVSGTITFSDEITVTLATVANATNLVGTTSGVTITNVGTNANVYVGAKISVISGPNMDTSGGDVFISTITGTGPYVLTLRNKANTFKGFDANTAITFKASTGNTSTWFASDLYTNPVGAAWAVLRTSNTSGKKLGDTYWVIYVAPTAAAHQPVGGVTPTVFVRAATGFNPSSNTVQGVSIYDWVSTQAAAQATNYSIAVVAASNTLVPITMRTRQSNVDTNFVSWAFIEGNNNRNNFFFSRYNNSIQPWDLNDVFLGAAYEVFALAAFNASGDSGINFRTRMTAIPKRMAEAGYGSYYDVNNTSIAYTNTYFRTSSGSRQYATPSLAYDDVMFYVRGQGDIQTGVTNLAIFKNVPINPAFAPVPYYLPSDFIIAEIPFGNATLGDTLTVSPSEVYTVIQFATNQLSFSTLVMAARTT